MLLLLAGSALAEDAPVSPPSASSTPASAGPSLDQDVQNLKQQVLELNRDLFVLQEDLLFPANTQVAVFVSMDIGTFFSLDSVKLQIDGEDVANYLYTPREVQALEQGGVQRFYIGNLKSGQHELIALFTGKGPHERDYRRGATIKLDKGIGAKFVELKISDLQRKLEPEFLVKVWE
jgi:hypothetical protein